MIIIGIAGGTGSGKTTVVKSIVEQVQTILKEHKISTSGLFWYEKGELAVPYKD